MLCGVENARQIKMLDFELIIMQDRNNAYLRMMATAVALWATACTAVGLVIPELGEYGHLALLCADREGTKSDPKVAREKLESVLKLSHLLSWMLS